MMKFMFWLLRILCLTGFIINLTIVNIFNFWSGLFTVLGVFAAIDVYVIGLLKHETIKGLPSLFFLIRFFQFVIQLLTDGIMWQHLAIHAAFDGLVVFLFIVDNRYTFIEKEDINTKAKTLVRRN